MALPRVSPHSPQSSIPISTGRHDPSVAVGTGVTSRPPRRSRRAAFPHRAPVEGQTRPAFGAWAAHPVPVRGLRPSGTCRFRLCVRGMRWPLPFLRPAAFPPRSPSPARRPALFEASSVLCSRPTPPTFRSGFAPRLPEPARDRRGGCGRQESSSAGELHPCALTEPYVKLSFHTALLAPDRPCCPL